jgi:hypothetical protein
VNHLENSKSQAKVSASVASTATHSDTIDCLGHKYLSLDVVFGAVVAAGTASVVAHVLKLEESDDNTAFSSISGFVGGTATSSTQFLIPTPTAANTGTDVVMRFDLDLRGHKRYVKVSATPMTAAKAVVTLARLGKAEDGVDNAAKKGANGFVSG